MTGPETLPLTRQTWRNVLALHFPVSDEALRPVVPPELELLLVDGKWWVTLSAFEVADGSIGPLPLQRFFQIELRTPVRDAEGLRGTWYLSVDATSAALAVEARAAFGMPYGTATIAIESDGAEDPTFALSARRPTKDPVRCSFSLHVEGTSRAPVDAEFAEALLFPERTWTRGGEGLKRIEVVRGEGRAARGRVEELDETWLWSAGLRRSTDAPAAQYIPKHDVAIYAPVVVR
ncbi:MAG: DUF2071 domain-containing protein [Thermoanaerobaculia bacterium]